jgi:hypothetical protein
MTNDTILPFSFPAVHAKKVTAAFDGGRLTSNGGAYASGERRREYRDHRLEWMVKSGGIDVVLAGLRDNTIRFPWPDPA